MYLLLATTFLAMASVKAPTMAQSNIRTMPVARTPESNTIVLTTAVPKNGEMVGNPVWIQFRIDGYALGAASQFERASEIGESKMGQTVHVIIDNEPYFPINEPAIDPFDEGGFYYDMSYKFEVPMRLKSGMHTIRMFPARSFGESLKGDKTFSSSVFYVGNVEKRSDMDLSIPFITYNEPSALMDWQEGKPVLLDFYVSNTELSPDGYKVRVSIDGEAHRTITSWQPYYIYGLKAGKHTVRLELINAQGKTVPGAFNDVKQTFTVR
jgi:hypothetical protein